MDDRTPAEVFPPARFILDELASRSWSQGDLAWIMGRPEKFVSRLVNGRCSITARTALELGAAFGTDPMFWLRAQFAWQLHNLPETDGNVARRVRERIEAGAGNGWAPPEHAVSFRYVNHRGEDALRRVVPKSIRFASTEHHSQEQWILEAFDLDRQADRSFAMADIREWEKIPPTA